MDTYTHSTDASGTQWCDYSGVWQGYYPARCERRHLTHIVHRHRPAPPGKL